MESFVIQETDGTFTEWVPRTLVALGLKEADLEAALVARPGPLVLGQLDLLYGDAVVYDQCRLRSGSGHQNIPDVILMTDHGDVIVVEVKRLGNAELRGRSVVSQVVGYAASLAAADEATLVRTLTGGRCSSWEALCREDFPRVARPASLARRLRRRVAEAELHLVIACDEAPESLADWVRAAGRQSALGFDLHVVEVRPMVPKGRRQPVAWVPAPQVSTEIIHRTAVVVRTEGTGPVQVDVTTDSAEEVEAAVQSSGRRDRRSKAMAVLAPAADRLGLSVEALWAELDGIHRHAIGLDWPDLHGAIAQPDDPGPYLRGRRGDGFLEGRFGVNLVKHWTPSVFVGAYLMPFDHKQQPLAEEDGGDFALIIDVARNKVFDGDSYAEQEAFTRLRERLQRDAGGWDFADHHAQAKRNRWHPLHLRRPLHEVLAEARTPAERRERWLAAARGAVRVLLAGGELAELREGFVREQLEE